VNALPPLAMAIFDTRVSFDAAALLVTWAALAFLTLIAIQLHQRVHRLERANAPVAEVRPYGRLIGGRIEELLGGAALAVRPRVVVALSGACPACERVLGEIASPQWMTPTVVLWTDRAPSVLPPLSANTIVPPNGPALAAKLGIAVTPFALWIDQAGEIARASPVNSLWPSDVATDHTAGVAGVS
jgi:hypothetical protein